MSSFDPVIVKLFNKWEHFSDEDLQIRMEYFIRIEDYEGAAQIRDELKNREVQKTYKITVQPAEIILYPEPPKDDH